MFEVNILIVRSFFKDPNLGVTVKTNTGFSMNVTVFDDAFSVVEEIINFVGRNGLETFIKEAQCLDYDIYKKSPAILITKTENGSYISEEFINVDGLTIDEVMVKIDETVKGMMHGE